MNERNNGLFRAVAASLILAAGGALLRLILIWRDVDPATGLFRNGGSFLCGLFNVGGVVLLAGYLTVAMILQARRKKAEELPAPPAEPEEEPEDEYDRFDKLFADETDGRIAPVGKSDPGVPPDVKSALTWDGTLSAFSYFLPGVGFLFFALSFILKGQMDALTFLYSIVCALCGGYFILAGLRNRADKPVPMAFLGLIPALWGTLRMIIQYRDVQKYVNRGLYVGELLFLISVVCFFVYQAQIALGDPGYAMPLTWVAAALLVVIFGLSVRVPQLFGLVLDRLGSADLTDGAGLLLDLSLTFFAGMKLSAIVRRGL
ncbi:MAG: hypothetical protein II776_01305 [Clostridia bacterium]|nr:hypothetical protein [Clostridia bacterium]